MVTCGCGWTYPYGFVIEDGCPMHDRELTAEEFTLIKRTELAWEWLLAFREGKELTDDTVAEFLRALDVASSSELAALRAANAEMREALVAMMEGSHWEEEHDYEGLRMPANWHTIRMPSSEALDKARAALNR